MANPLWAPWRMEYILAPKDRSRPCIFCGLGAVSPAEARERHLIASTEHAFVVLNEGARAGSDELIEHCRKSLAPYKVPSQIHLVGALPRTTVGKIDN